MHPFRCAALSACVLFLLPSIAMAQGSGDSLRGEFDASSSFPPATYGFDAQSSATGEDPSGTVTVRTEEGTSVGEVVCLYTADGYASVGADFGEGTSFEGRRLLQFFNVLSDPPMIRRLFSGTANYDLDRCDFNEPAIPTFAAVQGRVTIRNAGPPEPPASGDSAAGQGSDFGFPPLRRPDESYAFSVNSGPTGRDPNGSVVHEIGGQYFGGPVFTHYEGRATCLRVRGDRARIGVDWDPARSYEISEGPTGGYITTSLNGFASFTVFDGAPLVITNAGADADTVRSCPPLPVERAIHLDGGFSVVDGSPPFTQPCIEQRGTIRFTNPQCKRPIRRGTD